MSLSLFGGRNRHRCEPQYSCRIKTNLLVHLKVPVIVYRANHGCSCALVKVFVAIVVVLFYSIIPQSFT
jgi:hypothetical protein